MDNSRGFAPDLASEPTFLVEEEPESVKKVEQWMIEKYGKVPDTIYKYEEALLEYFEEQDE